MAQTLPNSEVQGLATVGLLLQYLVEPIMTNITAVDLAAKLLGLLQANQTINGQTVLSIVATSTGNSSLSVSGAEDILSTFQYMPTDRMHGTANSWIAMNVLSLLFMAARLWSRKYYSGGLRRDDYILIAAWIAATANTIEDTYLIFAQNWQAHCWNATLYQIKMHSKIGTADDYGYITSTFLFKTALLMFFHDLYPHRAFRRATYVMFGVVSVYFLFVILIDILNCHPFDTWNHPFTAKCIHDLLKITIFVTTFNIAIDLVILLMPLTVVYKLKLRKGDKFAAMFLIGLGSLTCITSILRYTTLKDFVKSSDVTQRAIPITTWSLLEPQIGIICACVPALRRLTINLVSSITSKVSSYGSFSANSDRSSKKHVRLDDSLTTSMGTTKEDEGDEMKIFKDVSCIVTSTSDTFQHENSQHDGSRHGPRREVDHEVV